MTRSHPEPRLSDVLLREGQKPGMSEAVELVEPEARQGHTRIRRLTQSGGSQSRYTTSGTRTGQPLPFLLLAHSYPLYVLAQVLTL